MITGKKVLSVLVFLLGFLCFHSPLHALDWIMDFDAGLDEALERGSPVFIFLCQDT